VLESRKLFGELVVEKGLAEPSKIEAALVEQQQVREVQQRRQTTETASSIGCRRTSLTPW
jgi:two-component system chemotaxis sensor kinase CheA